MDDTHSTHSSLFTGTDTLDSSLSFMSGTESLNATVPDLDMYSFFLDECDTDVDSDSEDLQASVENDLNPELLNPVYSGASLSMLDSYLLLLQYALRHRLNKKAFSELLKLVGAHLPANTTISSYKLNKVFLNLLSDICGETHYCC